MLKLEKKLPSGILVTTTGENLEEALQPFAEAVAVLSDHKCGRCGSDNLKPVHRKNEGYDFYEIRCGECRAELIITKTKVDNIMYVKRKTAAGEWDNEFGGWQLPYSQQQQQQQPQAQQQQQQPQQPQQQQQQQQPQQQAQQQQQQQAAPSHLENDPWG